MKRIGFLIVVMLCFLSTQCDEDEILIDFDNLCDELVIVDKDSYNRLVSDDFQFIRSASVRQEKNNHNKKSHSKKKNYRKNYKNHN